MASPILQKSLSLPRFLVFPTSTQVYAWRVASEQKPEETVSRHKNLEFAILRASKLNQLYSRRQPLLIQCAYQWTWGLNDGIQCDAAATVHDLKSEQEFCADHFCAIQKARGGQ